MLLENVEFYINLVIDDLEACIASVGSFKHLFKVGETIILLISVSITFIQSFQ